MVTGAGGYVGGRLVADLLTDPSIECRAVVHQPVSWLPSAIQRTIDLRTGGAALEKLCRGADALVHLAGPNEVVTAQEPEAALTDTLVAARCTALAAAAAGVRRLVYLSTVHVYGARLVDGATITEETVPEPRATYAIARLASEHLLATEAGGAEVAVLRMTNSVGAPADPSVERWSLVANDLARQAVTEGRLRLQTHGLQCRDFIPLNDVCRILAAVATSGAVPAGTYNLASGSPATVKELAGLVQDAVERISGSRPPLDAPPPPDAPLGRYTVSAAKLAACGLRPRGTLADAVDQIVRFCLERQEQLTT